MIKKYNQFVKGKINEDFELDYPEVDEPKLETPLLDEPELSNEFEGEEEEEEEAGDKYETALRKLADAAGVEFKSGDKSVIINGKEVTFPAEDEKYHIKGVKKGLTSIEDVMANINNGGGNRTPNREQSMEMPVESEEQFESKSYKYKRFKK